MQMREPYGITIFCDDIRYEMGGKITYVGVYHQTLNIRGELPIFLPVLYFAINLMVPSEYPAKQIAIKILKQKKNSEKEEVILDLPPRDLELGGEPEKYQRTVIHLNISPLHIDGDFTLKVRAYFDGKENKLGVLHVTVRSDKSISSATTPSFASNRPMPT